MPPPRTKPRTWIIYKGTKQDSKLEPDQNYIEQETEPKREQEPEPKPEVKI